MYLYIPSSAKIPGHGWEGCDTNVPLTAERSVVFYFLRIDQLGGVVSVLIASCHRLQKEASPVTLEKSSGAMIATAKSHQQSFQYHVHLAE